jgi:cellulose synthase/poly-beta-1,6-N-acetylglucosamine synthase-like glycosyltransferase
MRKVSVVIPCFNAEPYLPTALRSVASQTWPVDEIIVVDDGSRDRSIQIARSFGARCLSTGSNLGPSTARNIGINAAHNELIAFMDGDDYWDADHCETLTGLLREFPEAGLAFSRVRFVGSRVGESARSVAEGVPTWAFWDLLIGNFVPQTGAMARRTAVLEVGGYNPDMRYSEDYELWLRLSQRFQLVCSPRITANHRCHDAQASDRAVKLLKGAWDVRFRLLAQASEENRPAERARLAERLREAWSADLGDCWATRERKGFRYLLTLERAIPGAAAASSRWRRRARIWPLWVGSTAIWRCLPSRLRERLRHSPIFRGRMPNRAATDTRR